MKKTDHVRRRRPLDVQARRLTRLPFISVARRLLLSVTALMSLAVPANAAITSANVVGPQLQVVADGADDAITLRLLAGDPTQLEILGNNVVFTTVALATFTTIQVDGGAGNDTILIDEVNGAFTNAKPTTLLGGDGDDTITGGTGAETISGGNNNDTLVGGAGQDILQGGDGNDSLRGAQGGSGPAGDPGNELHDGGPGTDLMIWNPGDGNDRNEGGDGTDTLQFNGSNGNEVMVASANGVVPGRVIFTRDLGNIIMDIGTTENLLVLALGGDDNLSAGTGLAALIAITFDGGDGNDTIAGGDGADILRGGLGNDVITGGQGLDLLEGGDGNDSLTGNQGGTGPAGDPGNEQHLGGPGDDLMVWNPGDGNDRNEGGDGIDTLQFNGAGAAEIMAAVANLSVPGRVTFTRNVANIIMDIGTTENLLVLALGGDDNLTAGAGLLGLIAITFNGGAGADTFNTTASAIVTAIGGTEIDTLNFNSEGQPVSTLPGAIAVGGTVRTTHSEIENLNIAGPPSAPPTITITSPTPDPTTNSTAPFITLAGTAADDVAVQSVAWVNSLGGTGAATGTTNWTAADIPLKAGANVITVTATDASGNTASDVITVTVATLTYFLAEGATGPFFDLDIVIANPNTVEAPIVVTFLKDDATTVNQNLTLAPTSRSTIRVDDIPGLEATAVSTVVTSTNAVPLAVERSMFWDSTWYGSHGGTAVDGPQTRWLFAEGSQGFFDTFVLLANAGTTPANVTVTFLTEFVGPVVKNYVVAPTQRVNVATNGIPELANTSFSIVVDSDVPIIAERAMYFTTPARFWEGGHESAGVSAPATNWFLAEGATGSFFDTFILVGNPNPTAANVAMTFLTDTGLTVNKLYAVPGNTRLTVNIEEQDPDLASVAVSTTVSSDQPVVAERAMYWAGSASTWFEAHNSFGSTGTSLKWALAEGRVGTIRSFETYILLANANTTQTADVRITYLRTNGTTVVKNYTVTPTTRFNVYVNGDVPELVDESFGALIEVTNGVGISVERALYSNDEQGVVWAAGTNALATRVP